MNGPCHFEIVLPPAIELEVVPPEMPFHSLVVNQGNPGPAGAKGDQGEPGPAGAKGDQGDPGPAGAKGDQGDPGPAGAKGDQGDPGPAGAKGDQGDPGPAGAKGDQGDPGPAGAKGDQGDPGPTGAKGDQGDPGPAGAKGDQGDAGTAGAKGDQGDPGPAGAKGDQGDPGPAGSPDTAAQIRDKLATLAGDDRLDASAIKGLPSGGGSRNWEPIDAFALPETSVFLLGPLPEYPLYWFRFVDVRADSNGEFRARFAIDGAVESDSGAYTYAQDFVGIYGPRRGSGTYIPISYTTKSTVGDGLTGDLYLFNSADPALKTILRSMLFEQDYNTSDIRDIVSVGRLNSTDAINGIELHCYPGGIKGGIIEVYGFAG